jgi:hypothetical protein
MTPTYYVPDWIVSVTHFSKYGDGEWAPSPFLIQGTDELYWTNSIDEVLEIVKQELEKRESSGE